MKTRLLRIACLAVAMAAGASLAQAPSSYLAGREPDVLSAVPPPPAAGSPGDEADRAIFRRTRELEGTPRWALAQSDAHLSRLFSDFDCALGVSLSQASAPRLTALILRAVPDISAAYKTPKDVYQRLRPFTRDSGDICVPRSAGFARSYDYPSGHATWSWAVGLILAQIAPDRAGPILGRARAFGESRVVCGVHNASAVLAGRVAADTVMAALNADPAFRRDLAAARTEIDALRQAGARPDAEVCRTRQALTARTPW